jgi:hypothetical protein
VGIDGGVSGVCNPMLQIKEIDLTNIYVRNPLGKDGAGFEYKSAESESIVRGKILEALKQDMKNENVGEKISPDQGRMGVLGLLHRTYGNVEISIMPWYTETIKLLDQYYPGYRASNSGKYTSAYILKYPTARSWNGASRLSDILYSYEIYKEPILAGEVYEVYYEDVYINKILETLDRLANEQPELVTKVTDPAEIKNLIENKISRVYYSAFTPEDYAFFVESGDNGQAIYSEYPNCYPVIR